MKKYSLIFILFLISAALQAQSIAPVVIASAGKDVQNAGKRVAFTVGELVVTTVSGGNYTLTQGFHQPPSLYFTDIRKNSDSEISINAFPNPTRDIVNISIQQKRYSGKSYVEIYNIYGQRVYPPFQHFDVDNGENISIDLSELGHGAYFIRVFDPELNTQYTDFKVIKIR